MASTNNSASASAHRSPATVAVDNLMRRALRVSDPNNPQQLAKALLERYQGDAAAIAREAEGVPVVRVAPIVEARPAATAGSAEIRQARNDLDRDLDALVHESQLKDIESEMRGWAAAIRGAASRGLSAAMLGLDPQERNRAFAARRVLLDYARLARYMAALTSCVPGLFCRLAQSCDVMSSLILVSLGEALAIGGVTRTSVILQAPAAELQYRRESALSALRNLNGAVLHSHGPDDWPRGIKALRDLHNALEQNGAGDLRAFLDEAYLSNVFDELIALASDQGGDGLRALGASSVVTVARLERFVQVCSFVARPSAPPLATFLNALLLFTQAFNSARTGYRLVYVARPPLVFYGLYGMRGADDATERLINLIQHRGRLAQIVDCLCCCACDDEATLGLTVLAKILHDVDQAIDLLVQGTDPSGQGRAELRASAFGAVAQAALTAQIDDIPEDHSMDAPFVNSAELPASIRNQHDLEQLLEDIVEDLQWPDIVPDGDDVGAEALEAIVRTVHLVLCGQRVEEIRWRRLVESMSAFCRHDLILGQPENPNEAHPGQLMHDLLFTATKLLERQAFDQGLRVIVEDEDPDYFVLDPCPVPDAPIPATLETSWEAGVWNIALDGSGRAESYDQYGNPQGGVTL